VTKLTTTPKTHPFLQHWNQKQEHGSHQIAGSRPGADSHQATDSH